MSQIHFQMCSTTLVYTAYILCITEVLFTHNALWAKSRKNNLPTKKMRTKLNLFINKTLCRLNKL